MNEQVEALEYNKVSLDDIYDPDTKKYYTVTFSAEKNKQITNLKESWGRKKGERPYVKIAVLDTGMMTSHPQIKKCLAKSVNFSDDKDTEDHTGHGTLVTLILLAYGDVNLYNVKILNSLKKGSKENLIKGLEWCIENEINIVNVSAGIYNEECHGDCDVCKTASNSNMIICASSGNKGPDKIVCPAKAGIYGNSNVRAVGEAIGDSISPTSGRANNYYDTTFKFVPYDEE